MMLIFSLKSEYILIICSKKISEICKYMCLIQCSFQHKNMYLYAKKFDK